ncbi:nuclear protein localization protein 4 homolog [Neocloeon triangulifer]|uniref:nuclear protein localization protein 4 homolog n=1 Tax=Neocloeon triangulifer TaxID=2078957 RepID=UPI00286EB7B7|nr:nuclear protein localization protein 4 homolog [Neocloeon triangulifer]
MNSKELIIRVRSAEKMHRMVFTSPAASTSDLLKMVCEELKDSPDNYSLHTEQRTSSPAVPISSRNLLNKYASGQVFYLFRSPHAPSMDQEESMQTEETVRKEIVMEPIDVQLLAESGKIERGRDEKLCRHGQNGRCIHCSPLEPYDEAYLKEHNIKHLSFHSYLKKKSSSASGSKFLGLEDLECKIKPGCRDHLPWPAAVCTKCSPSAVTLNRQSYRHVDNVMFENSRLVERFLNFWRTTSYQRIGFLYGRYEAHTDVPLGIRATVAAIYEPPQENSKDLVKLLPDERQDIVDSLAQALGLKKVGWIFTDLVAEDIKKGTVKNLRGIDTHFLSAQECITAGYFQNQHPNYIHKSQFGSKFVTVCVTGDKNNQVHMEGYSVSNQCMALVRDNCLVPTKDAPELGYIRIQGDNEFVPDVFYKVTDEFKNEVQRRARPLPVEYLLVDVPASTPLNPQYTFLANQSVHNKNPFPNENRLVDKQIQDFNALTDYYQQFNLLNEGDNTAEMARRFLEAMSDFHVLLYLATMDMLPFKDHMAGLLQAVRTEDAEAAWTWSRTSQWTTVEQLMLAAGSSDMSAPSSFSPMNEMPSLPGAEPWKCKYCTYENQPSQSSCEMCNLPR